MGFHEKVTLPIAGISAPLGGVRRVIQLEGVWLGTCVGDTVAVGSTLTTSSCVIAVVVNETWLGTDEWVTSISCVGILGVQEVSRTAIITRTAILSFIISYLPRAG